MADLINARVLMIATDGFENDELFKPRQALIDAGAKVTLASIKTDPIQGEKGGEKADTITPDMMLERRRYRGLRRARPARRGRQSRQDADGGTRGRRSSRSSPTTTRSSRRSVTAPWLLVEADVVDGRKVTSWPSIRTDLENAGADVVDEEVVVDGKLITSRKPDDIPAFNQAVIDALEEELADA